MKFAKNLSMKKLFIRYEPGIDNGVVFIFNKENGKMLEGNYYTYLIVKAIQDGENLQELADSISELTDTSVAEVKNNFKSIIRYLVEEGFLYYVNR